MSGNFYISQGILHLSQKSGNNNLISNKTIIIIIIFSLNIKRGIPCLNPFAKKLHAKYRGSGKFDLSQGIVREYCCGYPAKPLTPHPTLSLFFSL